MLSDFVLLEILTISTRHFLSFVSPKTFLWFNKKPKYLGSSQTCTGGLRRWNVCVWWGWFGIFSLVMLFFLWWCLLAFPAFSASHATLSSGYLLSLFPLDLSLMFFLRVVDSATQCFLVPRFYKTNKLIWSLSFSLPFLKIFSILCIIHISSNTYHSCRILFLFWFEVQWKFFLTL